MFLAERVTLFLSVVCGWVCQCDIVKHVSATGSFFSNTSTGIEIDGSGY